MRKTKALSGAAQDAYFRRLLKREGSVSEQAREQLLHALKRDIAQLRLRRDPLPGAVLAPSPAVEPQQAAAPKASTQSDAGGATEAFDPFSPNIVVLLRTAGRAAALVALVAIENPAHLRLLAREQRLSIASDLASLQELRAAIVTAAERRIANRMAAAS